MSQLPPMSSPPPAFLPPAPRQGNAAAIISFVAGILFCIPGVGIIAVILGIVGIVKAGKPNVGGKGLAIAGLILGIIGLIWTGVAGIGALKAREMYAEGAPARAIARQFATDIGRGDAEAALKDCSSSISTDKVRATVVSAQSWGALQDSTLIAVGLKDANGIKTITVAGQAVFANAKKTFTATMDQEDSVYRVTDYNFVDQK